MTQFHKLKIGDFAGFVSPQAVTTADSDIQLNSTARWFCVVVKPQCQRRVEFELARLGFRSFHPKVRKWISHARVKKAGERPILGQYVFVEIDHPRQSYATVSAIHDVDRLVSNLGAPIPFPSHWVEGLIGRYLRGEWDEIANGKLPVGARIRIMEGEFADKLATVVSSKGKRVDIKILGETKVERVNECSVRAA